MTNSDIQVKLDTFSLAVRELVGQFLYRIDLDADYQREKIWSTADQHLLLDSVLKDIDIPKLYLAKLQNNKQFDYECIDGKQRMLTFLSFFKPDLEKSGKPVLALSFLNKSYSYAELKVEHPRVAEKIESYKLDFVSYNLDSLDDSAAEGLVREIFRRLQLGIKLNSGERLNALQGTLRDFVFKQLGGSAPFFRNTSLSSKRFSREFTLAQICLNSFKRKEIGEFVRARLLDLEDFFNDKATLDKGDPNLRRIEAVLESLDRAFGTKAENISSRAVAVSAYLFSEGLYVEDKADLLPAFAAFYIRLLEEIEENMELIRKYKNAKNPELMEQFQKYILQASVEPSAIRRRNDFLRRAFAYFTAPQTKGKLLGSEVRS